MANKAIGTLAVGSSVYLNVGGVRKEFLVVHQGLPSSLYDASCDGTWLLMKDCYENRQWNSSDSNVYETSTVNTYLNGPFLSLFDSNIQGIIKQVKIPYRTNGGSGGTDQSGANGLSVKIFPLSGYEVGWTTDIDPYLPVDGVKLAYFESGTSTSAQNKRIAYLNGSAVDWWLRSVNGYAATSVWFVDSSGGYGVRGVSASLGIRPALVLPSDTLVDDSGNVVTVDLTAHKTLINGTAYTVKGGKCMVNGTVYNILKGRTLIDGTGWDIAFPERGTKLSALDVGQSVFANVGGVRKEFLVVHQGKPSSLYDASCDGTWLLMKDIYENRQWNSSGSNVYETSTVNTYLNGPFLSLFDSNIKDVIKQVKIPYRKNGGSGGTDQSGANGLSAKIFLLSGYEVGFTTSDVPYFPIDGAKLSYFESGTGASAKNKRIAYLNGSAVLWWLRSPDTSVTDEVLGVYSDGDPYNRRRASLSLGIRPCIILPSDALVDDEFNLIA